MSMSTNAISSPPTDFSNLDELESLIKKYSLYSRSAFGLGHLPGWALLVLALSLNVPGIHRWGIWIAAAAPWVWLATREPIRRRLYQRAGRVTEVEMDPVLRNVMLVVLTVMCLIFAVQIRSLALPGVVAPISALAFMVVAVFRLRSTREANNWLNMVAFLLWYGAELTERHPGVEESLHAFWSWLLLLAVIALLGTFVYEHIQYRRLEKKLASLGSAL
jgi:hypothetical protein